MPNSKVTAVRVGRDRAKKSKFAKSFVNSSSANIGQIQPTAFYELNAGDDVNIQVTTDVQANPQVVPYTGEVEMRHYHTMVKLQDLWRPYNNMIAGQPYRPNEGDAFIPKAIPSVTYGTLLGMCLALDAKLSVGYNSSRAGVSNPTKGDASSYRWCIGQVNCSNTGGAFLVNASPSPTLISQIIYQFKSFGGDWLYFVNWAQYAGGVNTRHAFSTECYHNVTSVEEEVTYKDLTRNGDTSVLGGTQGRSTRPGVGGHGSMTVTSTQIYSRQLASSFDLAFVFDTGNFIAFNLGYYGKLLRKMMLGLGYQFSFRGINEGFNFTEDSRPPLHLLSALKFMGLYKVHFDLFAVQRTVQFSDTNCYALINQLSDSPNHVICNTSVNIDKVFFEMLHDYLDLCHYNLKPDYFSTAIADTTGILPRSVDYSAYTGQGLSITGHADVHGLSYADTLESEQTGNIAFNGTAIKLALKLAKFVNKNTVIGANVRKYFYNKYGVDVYSDSFSDVSLLGVDVVSINNGKTVNCTASTEAPLGSFGGHAGTSRNGSRLHSFRAQNQSYFYTLSVLIPLTGYYQGTCKDSIRRFDFFTPEFDSLGYQALMKMELIADTPICTIADKNDSASIWGFVPRYMDKKIAPHHIVNGDKSLPSLDNEMSGYQLNRKFITGLIDDNGCSEPCAIIQNTDAFRRIGDSEQMGNFNRPFRVIDGSVDNWLFDLFFTTDVYSNMLPYAESFDTDAEFNDSASVEKA